MHACKTYETKCKVQVYVFYNMTNQIWKTWGTTLTPSQKNHTVLGPVTFSFPSTTVLMPGYLPLKYYTRTSHSSTKALNSVRNNYPHSLKETNLSDPRNCFWSTIMQHERQSCFSLHPSAHIV